MCYQRVIRHSASSGLSVTSAEAPKLQSQTSSQPKPRSSIKRRSSRRYTGQLAFAQASAHATAAARPVQRRLGMHVKNHAHQLHGIAIKCGSMARKSTAARGGVNAAGSTDAHAFVLLNSKSLARRKQQHRDPISFWLGGASLLCTKSSALTSSPSTGCSTPLAGSMSARLRALEEDYDRRQQEKRANMSGCSFYRGPSGISKRSSSSSRFTFSTSIKSRSSSRSLMSVLTPVVLATNLVCGVNDVATVVGPAANAIAKDVEQCIQQVARPSAFSACQRFGAVQSAPDLFADDTQQFSGARAISAPGSPSLGAEQHDEDTVFVSATPAVEAFDVKAAIDALAAMSAGNTQAADSLLESSESSTRKHMELSASEAVTAGAAPWERVAVKHSV